MIRTTLVLFGLGLAGCSATVPVATPTMSAATRTAAIAPDRAAIYVIRDCAWAGKVHEVTIDQGRRMGLACGTFVREDVEQGSHTVVAMSTENRAVLPITAVAGQPYYVALGWKTGSGTGDLQATLALLSPSEGKQLVERAELVDPASY